MRDTLMILGVGTIVLAFLGFFIFMIMMIKFLWKKNYKEMAFTVSGITWIFVLFTLIMINEIFQLG